MAGSGSTAEIGIRVFLEDAAVAGLSAINDNLKRMESLAKSASSSIQSLADNLSRLNGGGGASTQVATALDAQAAAIKSVEAAESSLGATDAELAAAQREVADSSLTLTAAFRAGLLSEEEWDAAVARVLADDVALVEETGAAARAVSEQAQAMQEAATASSEAGAALREVAAATREQAQVASEAASATKEAASATKEETASTISLKEAQAQLLGTVQARLQGEEKSIAIMREIAAEDKAAAAAAKELGAASQTVAEKMGLSSAGVTKFNAGAKELTDTASRLVPVLDENGKATGAWTTAIGNAAPRVEELKKQGQALLSSQKDLNKEEEKTPPIFGKQVQAIADVINEYMAMAMMIQMVVSAFDSFIALGAGIENTFNTIQGMTASSDAQMQQWKGTIGSLDQQYGILETDSVSALGLITKAQFQGADATTVLSDAMLLANSSGETLADSTKAITLAMNIYGLSAAQGRQVSLDFFNALSESTLPLSDYVSLLDQSGLTARQLGVSETDLISTLGKMGQVMGGSTITVRAFQSVLDGLMSFSEQDTASLNKLAQGFNQTSFAALNSTGKFLELAAAAGGNERAFRGMIGGTTDANAALKALDISTKQLAINARNLGLSFDPIKFNSLDAAGKLLYLAQVADFNTTKFNALTKGGIEPVAAALLKLEAPMDAAAKKLAAMTPTFDMAAFKAADLSQKLHMLADFVGGPGTAAFATFVGGIKNVPMAMQIMNQEADQTPGHMKKSSDAAIKTGDAYKKMMNQIDNATQDYQAQLTKQDNAASKVSDDVKHQTDAMKSAWQGLSDKFVTDFGPAITKVLKGLSNDFSTLGGNSTTFSKLMKVEYGVDLPKVLADAFDKIVKMFKDTFETNIPKQIKHADPVVQKSTEDYTKSVQTSLNKGSTGWEKTFADFFSKDAPKQIQHGTPVVQRSTEDYTKAVQKSFDKGSIDWGKVFSDFFGKTVPQLIKDGQPPADGATTNYTTSISKLLTSGGVDWGAIIKQAVTTIENLFTGLAKVLVGASIVPDMVNLITSTFRTGAGSWVSTIQTGINNLVSTFSSLPGKVMTFVNNMVSQVLAAVGGLAGRMYSSGLNAVSQFASGIAAGAGQAVANALSVAARVAAVLAHHSPPKEGPMKDDDTWMPNMMHMFAAGIAANTPLFSGAALGAASGVASGISAVPQMARLGGSGIVQAQGLSQGGVQTINLVLDGRVVTQVVLNNLTGQMQLNGMSRAFR